MKVQDVVGVDFVNNLIGRGILNGVINLTFGVYNFSPNQDNVVEADNVVASRLRMDIPCAKQLRDALNELLSVVEQSEQVAPKSTKRISPDNESEGVVLKGSETSH